MESSVLSNGGDINCGIRCKGGRDIKFPVKWEDGRDINCRVLFTVAGWEIYDCLSVEEKCVHQQTPQKDGTDDILCLILSDSPVLEWL